MPTKSKMFILKDFWPQFHNDCIAGFFRIANFFYNFYWFFFTDFYQCFYQLPKLKTIQLNVSIMQNVYKSTNL